MAFIAVERTCHKITQGFSILNIQDSNPFDPRWEVASNCDLESVRKILSQPYRIIHAGGQNYAFTSEDGNYVLKITKHKNMRVPIWARVIPSLPAPLEAMRERSMAKKKRVFEATFTSYVLAKKLLEPFCGIVYMHLNKSDNLKAETTLIDFIGNRYVVNLDEHEFILQVRGVTTFKYLDGLIEKGQTEKVKEAIAKLLHYASHRIRLGLEDHDFILRKNFGFYNDEPLQIDIGSLRENPTFRNHNMFVLKMNELKDQLIHWAENSHPELVDEISERVSEMTSPSEQDTKLQLQ